MKITTRNLTLSAVFLSIGLVLPLFTMQIKEIGDTLLPMHLPVMLCGLLCGPLWGGSVGLILPFLRSAIFSMPPMYPNAVWMAAELAAYGFIIGFVYNRTRKNILGIYISLITAMLGGRLVWGAAKALLLGLAGKGFTFTAFLVGGFVDALLGIVLQLVLVPIIVRLFERKKVLTK